MKLWQRPFFRLLAVFLFLGLFAFWTFRTVSLPPALRDLSEEDQALAAATTPPTEEEKFREELKRLPTPPQNHAPEVAALLQRLRSLPPAPYLLQVALQREASTPAEQPPAPWNEAEIRALTDLQAAFRQAWLPFLSAPPPDWRQFPDSTALFRFQDDFLATDWKTWTDLFNPSPETPGDPALTLAYLRQIRTLGALQLGTNTDTVAVANRIMKTLETLVVPMDLPLPTLLAIRENLPPPPTLADLRVGLETDRALLLRTAQFLESLPPGTSAAAGLTRWLGARAAVGWNLNHSGRFVQARDLAADLSRQASALEHLVQKTFLAGPAWRQWLSANPAAGLPPLLTDGLDGFRFFEQTRSDYQLARAALEVRLALQTTGADAARKIPDPLVPGSFLQIEVSEDRLTTFGSSLPASADVPPRFRLPDSLRSALNLAAEKTSPDVPGR